MTNHFWDERFKDKDYIYGERPNLYFEACLSKLKPGKLLLPAEGEGRNAVFAAKKGWDVTAVDNSEVGRKKALQLAQKEGVDFEYHFGDVAEFDFGTENYDAIGLVFMHLPPEIRYKTHQKLVKSLKKGGVLIAAFFNKDQIHLNSGGPKDVDMLYDLALLRKDFSSLKELEGKTLKERLDEGKYHQGTAELLHFRAAKI